MKRFLFSTVLLSSIAACGADPDQRTKDWLPPAGTLVLPVWGSASGDGRYCIGWGYDKGPIEWRKLAYIEESTDGVTFSTRLATGPLGALENDGNFLLNALTGKPICKLGFYYPGERDQYNHLGLVAIWSPTSDCVVIIVRQKWETEYAHIAWISDGKCEGSNDILEALRKVTREAILKSAHPAAKRLKEEDDFGYTLSEIHLNDDGSFRAALHGEVPRLEAAEGFFEVKIRGSFTPGAQRESAGLKSARVEVLVP